MPAPFFTQPKNEIAAPLRNWDRLRAEGNLDYDTCVALIKKLWKDRSPDIPIHATQGKNFAKYPCIVWATEVRVPHREEPKRRIREYITAPNGQMYKITGQIFKHIISFTVITENDPDLADQILTAFEKFVDEIEPVLHKVGVSNWFYGRRLPDSVETRDSADICKRAVTYEAHFEIVKQIPVDQLNEILIRARTFVEQIRNRFTGHAGDDFIEVEAHGMPVGTEVLVDNDPDDFLPVGLNAGHRYIVDHIDDTKLYLTTLSGAPINLQSDGVGRLSIWLGHIETDIEDEFATPNS